MPVEHTYQIQDYCRCAHLEVITKILHHVVVRVVIRGVAAATINSSSSEEAKVSTPQPPPKIFWNLEIQITIKIFYNEHSRKKKKIVCF